MGKSPTKKSNKNDRLVKDVALLLQDIKKIPITSADLAFFLTAPRNVYIGNLTGCEPYDLALISSTQNNRVTLRLGSTDFQRAFARLIYVMKTLKKNIPRNVQKMINTITKEFPNGGNSLFNENVGFMKTFLST